MNCFVSLTVSFSARRRSCAKRGQEVRIGEDPGGQRRSSQRLDSKRLLHRSSGRVGKSGILNISRFSQLLKCFLKPIKNDV